MCHRRHRRDRALLAISLLGGVLGTEQACAKQCRARGEGTGIPGMVWVSLGCHGYPWGGKSIPGVAQAALGWHRQLCAPVPGCFHA